MKHLLSLLLLVPFIGCEDNKKSHDTLWNAGDTVHVKVEKRNEATTTELLISDTTLMANRGWVDSAARVYSRVYCLIGFVKGDGNGKLSSGTMTISFDRPPTLKDIIRTIKKDKSNGWNKHSAVVSVSYFNSKSDYENFYK